MAQEHDARVRMLWLSPAPEPAPEPAPPASPPALDYGYDSDADANHAVDYNDEAID